MNTGACSTVPFAGIMGSGVVTRPVAKPTNHDAPTSVAARTSACHLGVPAIRVARSVLPLATMIPLLPSVPIAEP
jgi:hypothetical protein